jgi:2-polyprenyl-6-methoxyphenol hydroxylase-like FAD-dependent oxidoreductase
MADYDLITVGGGLAGSALARSMAQAGKRVLVIESETEYRDRVRGEQMTAWGVAEAKELGILDPLVASGAYVSRWWDIYIGPMQIAHRNLFEETPQQLGNLSFYHPQMQETLIQEAEAAGAEVRRGASVRAVEPGHEPAVTIGGNGAGERVTARLIAGCDGRNSSVRNWGSFESSREPDRLQIAGLFVEDLDAPEDTLIVVLDIGGGESSIVFPQGGGRARTYSANRVADGKKYTGAKDIPAYLDTLRRLTPNGEAMFKNVRPSGPLATFNGADSYVRQPYKDGIALVGDAASSSDPSWGQGLSLTVRDVRTLRDALLATDDWDAAGKAYAAQHDRYYENVRACEDWFTTFFYMPGAEADAFRARAFPLIAQDGARVPDTFQAGPELAPADEQARRTFFAEE